MSFDFDYILKFIIIGDSSVGKSNIFYQFQDGIFQENSVASVGVQLCAKNLKIDNTIFRLQVWDTAGQENFRSLISTYYKNSSCAFIVYDITEEQSFYNLDTWIQECKNIAPETILLVLIGNKTDLNERRKIEYNKGLEYAQKHNMIFFEASAKDGTNIQEIFIKSVECINKNIQEGKYDLSDDACGVKLCKNQNNLNLDDYDIGTEEGKKFKKCCP